MLWVRNPAGRRLPGEQQDTNRHGNACCSKLLSSAGYNIFLIARHPTTSSYKTAPVTFRQGSVWVWSVWSSSRSGVTHSPRLRSLLYPSWPRSEGCWNWWGWCCAWVFSPRWSDTWAFSPSLSAGRAFPHHAVCLEKQWKSVNVSQSSKPHHNTDKSKVLCFVMDALPKNVLEMYSETWLPDLLISDRCVNSLFNIRLNCTDR